MIFFAKNPNLKKKCFFGVGRGGGGRTLNKQHSRQGKSEIRYVFF